MTKETKLDKQMDILRSIKSDRMFLNRIEDPIKHVTATVEGQTVSFNNIERENLRDYLIEIYEKRIAVLIQEAAILGVTVGDE